MNSSEIRNLRKSLNLTQEQFAARLGIARSTVAKWECGETKPSKMALKLLEALK